MAMDAPALILEHLGTSDGLPQSTVFATLQDSQGFVWLATEDGLVRYDGSELVRYAYRRDQHGSLPGNYIYQIAEDHHHDLWIAIKDAGLARYNRATNDFTVYRHDARNPDSLASDSVRAVLVDEQDHVWIGTSDAGLDMLDIRSGRIEHLRHDDGNASSLSANQISTLALDHSGGLWVGTAVGLDRWLPVRHAFLHWRHIDGDQSSLSGKQVLAVLEDHHGSVWVGTFGGGLTQIDPAGRIVRSFHHDGKQPSSLASDDVRALLEDRAGHLWVGTADGLDLLDSAGGRFTHYRHQESDPESLRDSFVLSLYEDETGLVWIGTQAGGVSRWNPRSWELGAHRPSWLGNRLVTAFADAGKGLVWVASDGGGLERFDDDSGKATPIDQVLGRHNALGESRVMSLHRDRHGMLWIGTLASGLRKLSVDGRIDAIPAKLGDPHALSAAGVMTVFESRDDRIWVGLYGGGVNVIDPRSGLIRQLPYGTAPGAVSAPNVRAIAEDADGDLWIGTDGGGLDLARADGSVVAVYRHDPNNPASLPSNRVYAVSVDARGRVWVATDGGGLALVTGSARDPASIGFKIFSREQGLSSDSLYSVLPDAHGQLWLSGNSGLIRFDPDSGNIKTFHHEDGLQGEEFDSGASALLSNGRLCFGGPGGFNIFDPQRISEAHEPPRLALTQVEVLGAPAPQSTPYWLLHRVDLGYRASIVSFDVSVLDFSSPRHNRVAYRVMGLTDKWIDLGAQHRLTLTNLDPGDHLLEVRAANSDSVWSDAPLRLLIHKQPAPWRSTAAYALYALLALVLIANGVRLQRVKIRRIQREHERLESEVALRTRELLESNRQLAEAMQARSRFLDRMSHELRTPMNGVVGMTELLERTQLSAAQTRLTRTIRSSARVLLQILNDLLDLSKANSGKMGLEELPLDLVEIVEECASLFDGESKGVDLITCLPPAQSLQLHGDPLRIRQILINLISNAFKFTQRGEIVVRAELEPDETSSQSIKLVLTVQDTGIGMDAATVEKIFEPFTQADESITRRYGGSGLGLAICRELVELMGGTISVQSQLHVGSTFRATLPLRCQPAEQTSPSLPACRTRILARRPALATSLAAHAEALGLRLLSAQPPASAPDLNGDELILLDADSYADQLANLIRRACTSRTKLVLVADVATVEQHCQLTNQHCHIAWLVKPVRREALLAGVRQVLEIAAPRSTPLQQPGHQTAAHSAARRGHVLLVEDEPVNAAVARGYLEALGCSCVWVTNGSDAMARSSTERFDLILMDLSMPQMDGFAAVRLMRLRAGSERVPIIALSARDAHQYRDACLEAGMNDMLEKPYTLDQCGQLLQQWIPAAADQVASANVSAAHTAVTDQNPLAAVDPSAVVHLRTLRTDGASDLYSELVELFHRTSSQALLQLRTSLSQADLATAAAICHRLSAAAANVGALRFAHDLRRLEQHCRSGAPSLIRPLHQRLLAAYPSLIDELMRTSHRATA